MAQPYVTPTTTAVLTPGLLTSMIASTTRKWEELSSWR